MSQTPPPPSESPTPARPGDVGPSAGPPHTREPGLTPESATSQSPEGSSKTTPAVTTPPQDRAPGKDPLRRSRTGGAFVGLIVVAALLVLLLIFIFQNTQSVNISFLGFDGSAPLSLALVIAAVAGMVIVALVASLRILQLRHRVKHEKKKQRR